MKNSAVFYLVLMLCLCTSCEDVSDDIIVESPFTVDDSGVPDSIRKIYWEESNRIAIRNIYANGSSHKDSILIPPDSAQPYYFAVVNLYNETEMSARDSVIELYPFDFFPDRDLHTIYVDVDSSATWTRAWQEGGLITGVRAIDSLTSLYDLEIVRFYDWTRFSGSLFFVLETELMVNAVALADEFSTLPMINHSESGSWLGDGDRVYGRWTDETVFITLEKRWGDCPAGCIARHSWKFSVTLQGAVEYLGSVGNPIF